MMNVSRFSVNRFQKNWLPAICYLFQIYRFITIDNCRHVLFYAIHIIITNAELAPIYCVLFVLWVFLYLYCSVYMVSIARGCPGKYHDIIIHFISVSCTLTTTRQKTTTTTGKITTITPATRQQHTTSRALAHTNTNWAG